MALINYELRSRIDDAGRLRVWLEELEVAAPAADEVVVQVEAAPLNPSDQILLFGPADPKTLKQTGSAAFPVIEGQVPAERLPAISGRLGQALPVGNEGAGTVVSAGDAAKHLVGRQVAIRAATGTYSRYQTVKAAACLLLPEGVSAREGAAACINPLTALGMVETLRREGHRALVHTAAASNLGQMLNRQCLADGVPLVNIVRSQAQVSLLHEQGARYVIDSSADHFQDALVAALDETGATLAFDAIGGGTMAATILSAMEKVAARRLSTYSRYGSPTHKQVYIYGGLDPSPRVLDGQFGMAWGVGGWLMTWFYDRIGSDAAAPLLKRAADELTTTFASQFSDEIGLAEMLSLDAIRAYTRRATGEKFLVLPQQDRA
ncbi:NADH oxidase [Sphingomonas sp.]|uniref:NADH oxidase n=1 Tax=Sphingomonas sp. TaxID=28214 RepID=UPI003B3ABA8E